VRHFSAPKKLLNELLPVPVDFSGFCVETITGVIVGKRVWVGLQHTNVRSNPVRIGARDTLGLDSTQNNKIPASLGFSFGRAWGGTGIFVGA